MNYNYLLAADGAGSGLASTDWSIWVMIAIMVVMMIFMTRSQKKREKQANEMRNSVEVGDGVTTIGGIVGRVLSIREDSILIETGADRSKLRIMKWAIQDVEKLELNTKSDKSDKDEKDSSEK